MCWMSSKLRPFDIINADITEVHRLLLQHIRCELMDTKICFFSFFTQDYDYNQISRYSILDNEIVFNEIIDRFKLVVDNSNGCPYVNFDKQLQRNLLGNGPTNILKYLDEFRLGKIIEFISLELVSYGDNPIRYSKHLDDIAINYIGVILLKHLRPWFHEWLQTQI